MRIYISIDIEGVAGVVHRDQCIRGRDDYPRAAELMTREANAAALGAFDAGATEVLINDSHGDMRNLRLDLLDPRVDVLSGNLKEFSMAQGVVDGQFALALFIGYHGGAGTAQAILDHTYRGAVVHAIRLGGREFNEAGLNAWLAGSVGTAVGLVTGDASTCRQCAELVPGVDTLAVKSAVGRLAARSMHPQRACAAIRDAAAKAVAEYDRFVPLTLPSPHVLEIDVVTTAMADAAALIPTVRRTAARTLRYESAQVRETFRAMLAIIKLAGTTL